MMPLLLCCGGNKQIPPTSSASGAPTSSTEMLCPSPCWERALLYSKLTQTRELLAFPFESPVIYRAVPQHQLTDMR